MNDFETEVRKKRSVCEYLKGGSTLLSVCENQHSEVQICVCVCVMLVTKNNFAAELWLEMQLNENMILTGIIYF